MKDHQKKTTKLDDRTVSLAFAKSGEDNTDSTITGSACERKPKLALDKAKVVGSERTSAESERKGATVPQPEGRPEEPRANQLRIMVLDDEPIVGKRLNQALSKYGIDVEVFEDPARAVTRLGQTHFDVVVTDLRMAELDGIQILEYVASNCKDTAGIAHELNNPLNNVMLTASMLQEDFHGLSKKECLELVNDLVGESERAQKIVRNLLDFAREGEMESESSSVQRLVEETLRLASNQIKLAKVKVESEMEENLPPIYGDRQQLEQVFLNLVLNALDAMPDGGVLKIKVSNTTDRESVAVTFEDTGIGIPKQHLGDIFDPFFTSKKAAKGTGLGLSVSLGIIQGHGGDIRVESEVGRGTVFTVLLPVAKVPADIAHPFAGAG